MLHVPYSAIPFFGISKEHTKGGRFVAVTPLSSFFIGMSSMRKAAARVRPRVAEAGSRGVSVRAEAHANKLAMRTRIPTTFQGQFRISRFKGQF